MNESFLHDSNGIRAQIRVMTLINTCKGEGNIANNSLFFVKLSPFSSFKNFFQESLMPKLRIKVDRGEVHYLICNFVKFPFSRVNGRH